MREDLMCFARLYLIVHYEMGKDFNLVATKEHL
jgi:hypothetical protein